jgi:hypothetical protein
MRTHLLMLFIFVLINILILLEFDSKTIYLYNWFYIILCQNDIISLSLLLTRR